MESVFNLGVFNLLTTESICALYFPGAFSVSAVIPFRHRKSFYQVINSRVGGAKVCFFVIVQLRSPALKR